jgi:hypothetical protein
LLETQGLAFDKDVVFVKLESDLSSTSHAKFHPVVVSLPQYDQDGKVLHRDTATQRHSDTAHVAWGYYAV